MNEPCTDTLRYPLWTHHLVPCRIFISRCRLHVHVGKHPQHTYRFKPWTLLLVNGHRLPLRNDQLWLWIFHQHALRFSTPRRLHWHCRVSKTPWQIARRQVHYLRAQQRRYRLMATLIIPVLVRRTLVQWARPLPIRILTQQLSPMVRWINRSFVNPRQSLAWTRHLWLDQRS